MADNNVDLNIRQVTTLAPKLKMFTSWTPWSATPSQLTWCLGVLYSCVYVVYFLPMQSHEKHPLQIHLDEKIECIRWISWNNYSSPDTPTTHINSQHPWWQACDRERLDTTRRDSLQYPYSNAALLVTWFSHPRAFPSTCVQSHSSYFSLTKEETVEGNCKGYHKW